MAQILIIDDDPDIRLALKQALRKTKHDVLTAANGDEGLKLCRIAVMNLVILDLFMPEKDGLVTIIELRKEFPKLPIIAVSGGHLTAPSLLDAAQKLGANKILVKPFEPAKFLKVIQETLHS